MLLSIRSVGLELMVSTGEDMEYPACVEVMPPCCLGIYWVGVQHKGLEIHTSMINFVEVDDLMLRNFC